MYGKIFTSMYEGSLYGQWEAIVTFQQLIALADEQGVIDMTPPAIAARTSIPLEHIQNGIKILSEPDPYSRTPGEDGKRIIPLDDHKPWGWVIVNYAKYRRLASYEDKKKADRERIATKREIENSKKINNVAECSAESQQVANVAYTDTDTDNIKHTSKSKISPCPHKDVIECYHSILPTLPKVTFSRWKGSKRERDLLTRWREDERHQNLDFWKAFFETVKAESFWMGENDRGWKADLGWLLERKHFDKVIERGMQ